ncbi:unnamed protein product [Closterium sp. NIES-64]|nr:unnamed protein product [Closterium sp. NIES-64]
MPRASPTSSRNILIAVDPSPDSEKAVAWALKNHIRPSDRVTLLHVRPVVESGPGLFAAYADSTLSAEAMAEVDRVREKHNAGVAPSYAGSTLSAEAMAEVDRVREKHNAGVAPSYAGSTLSAEAMAEVDRVIEKHNAGVAWEESLCSLFSYGSYAYSTLSTEAMAEVDRLTFESTQKSTFSVPPTPPPLPHQPMPTPRSYADSTLSAEAMAEVDRVIEKHNAGVRRKFVSNLSHQLDQAKYDIVAVQGADPSPGRTRILGSASAGIHMNSLRLLLDSALPPSLSCLPQVQYDIVAVQDADLRERICESPCNEHVLSAAFSPPFLCLSYHLPLVLWPPPPGAIRHSGSAGRGSQGAHLPRGGEDEGTYTHHGVSGTQYREAVRCGAEMVQYGEAVRERSVVR